MLVGVGSGLGSDGHTVGVRSGNSTERGLVGPCWIDGRCSVDKGATREELYLDHVMERSRRAGRGGGSLVRSLSCGQSFS